MVPKVAGSRPVFLPKQKASSNTGFFYAIKLYWANDLNHLIIQSKIAIIVTEINGFSIFRLLGMRMISQLKSTFQQLHECNWFSFSFGEPTKDLLVTAQNAIDFFEACHLRCVVLIIIGIPAMVRTELLIAPSM